MANAIQDGVNLATKEKPTKTSLKILRTIDKLKYFTQSLLDVKPSYIKDENFRKIH